MHAIACIVDKRFGHKGNLQSMLAGAAKHDAPQHNDVICSLERIAAVLEIDFKLSRRSLLDDGINGQTLSIRCRSYIIEKIGIFIQIIQPIHALAVRSRSSTYWNGHGTIIGWVGLEQVELNFKGNDRVKITFCHCLCNPHQCIATIEAKTLFLWRICRQQHLSRGSVGPRHTAQCSGHSTAKSVTVTTFNMQARFRHFPSPNIQPVN